MSLPPYLYETPVRVLSKIMGVDLPIEEILSDEYYIGMAVNYIDMLLKEERLPSLPNFVDNVVVYHVSLAIAGKSGSIPFIRKIIKISSDHAREMLRKADSKEILRYARMLGTRVEESSEKIPWLVDDKGHIVHLTLIAKIDVAEYLSLTAGSEGILSLPNSFLRDGYVYLDRARAIELVAKAVERRVSLLIEKYRGLELGKRLQEEAMRIASRMEVREGEIDWDALPACMKRLLENGGETDEEAYLIISFLASIKPSRDEIVSILVRTGLASLRAAENLADAVLAIKGVYPYKCTSHIMKNICGDACGRGVLREYYSARRRRKGRG